MFVRILRCGFAAIALLGATPAATMQTFAGGSGWVNSAPLDVKELAGKVVLVDFWEYTCINCLRTLPYLKTWYARYGRDGFTIVGVHTPEFAFSGESTNVTAAVKRLGIEWPVVLDDRFAIWNRYDNHTWPHELLYDQDGRLVEDFPGEGGYPETEANIQALLRARNPHLTFPPVMALLPQDSYAKPGAVCYPQTQEILVGHQPIADASAFTSGATDTNYVNREPHRDGAIYLQGYWHLTPQAAVSGGTDGFVALRYHAIEVVAVLKSDGGPTRVAVTQDGKPIARADAGSDIRYAPDGSSFVDVDAPRAYELLVNARFASHELRLSPNRYGLGLYSVAFESCEVPGVK